MLDLPKQSGHPGRVTRSTAGQIRRDDLTCIGIDSEVQLPPSPSLWRFPQVADVNPESRTIEEQMGRSSGRELAKPDLAELLKPPGQRRVIGDREVHLEQVSKAT